MLEIEHTDPILISFFMLLQNQSFPKIALSSKLMQIGPCEIGRSGPEWGFISFQLQLFILAHVKSYKAYNTYPIQIIGALAQWKLCEINLQYTDNLVLSGDGFCIYCEGTTPLQTLICQRCQTLLANRGPISVIKRHTCSFELIMSGTCRNIPCVTKSTRLK